ncbi:toprim domain-containing protein [uncultured Alistipes sp.]|jgi:DNA primase (bacterial type)|uniref:toprim domain-containing protein n=1 Tax=uncultured Alistipes sp. TaxID=538949 RepID=UPI0025ED1705|nr:toprim domain-containing protein [uncultured Alistipes sp.]
MELNHIKQISIRGYLANRGITPKTEKPGYGMYLSPLREERTASFKVDWNANLWHDFGTGEGGSIIDLVSRMENCSVAEAIRRLDDGSMSDITPSHIARQLQPSPNKSRIEILHVGELVHPALVSYLRDRGIDLATARKYCNEVRYAIAGKEYFAIGFKNYAGGWELRNRNFKGSSTPKNITTIRNGSDTVMVFEGFIDFLSYLSMKGNSSPTIDTAVLNSVSNLTKAIPFLQSHRTVHAFLDNDDAGRKALASLRASLPSSEVVDQSAFYRHHKDLNDYWQGKRVVQKQAPVPVKKKGRSL